MVVILEQAIYAKAMAIIWKQKDSFFDILPQMRVFHNVCTLLKITGKQLKDAWLNDLCFESGVIVEDSI